MLPATIPIFPLPNAVLFPNVFMPLHIFEARYRAMVTDVLPRDKRLALVGLQPGYEQSYAGKPPVYPVGGVGEIVKWERLANGRYNILLRGDARVRIERELPTDTLYRVVSTRCLEETSPTRDLDPLVERVRSLCRRLLRAVGRPQELLDEALREGQEPGAIADQIASAVLPGARLRQELLETLDVDRRLQRLVAALEDLVRHVRGRNPKDTG